MILLVIRMSVAQGKRKAANNAALRAAPLGNMPSGKLGGPTRCKPAFAVRMFNPLQHQPGGMHAPQTLNGTRPRHCGIACR